MITNRWPRGLLRVPLPRRWLNRRVALLLGLALLLWVAFFWLVLPPDNHFVLFLRFTAHRVLSSIAGTQDVWYSRPPSFPVDLDRDAAYILKTGYGTQERIPAQLKALGLRLLGNREERVLVVGDFSFNYTKDGQAFKIHDMLKASMEHEALSRMQDADRLVRYRDMTKIVSSANKPALDVGMKYGWELDAMKFLPALEIAWNTLPRKKWYLMLDDDTFVVRPSLQLLLGHLDPSQPNYLGNAVGDYKGRFAHGGSAIALSEAAMARLFDQNPEVVRATYVDSLTETWGDRLVALAFMKVGVYLDERYGRFFNGERPLVTRIRADRFCAPLVSFHGLTQPAQMIEVGRVFRDVAGPVFWAQLWELYRREPLSQFADNPVRRGVDHVGRPDDQVTTTSTGVDRAEACLARCRASTRCLAWTWEKSAQSCRLAPWLVIGEEPAKNPDDFYSGIVADRAQALRRECDGKWPSS